MRGRTLVERRRSRRLLLGADVVADLVKALGGDADVPAFYWTERHLTLVGGNVTDWGDARGAGYAPAFDTASGAPLAYSAALGGIVLSGGSLATPASSLFDLSAPVTLAVVGRVTRQIGQYHCSIADAIARTRGMAVKNVGGTQGTIAGSFYSGGAETTVTSNVDADGTTRFIAFVEASALVGTVDVMNFAAQTAAISALGAGANRLTIGDLYPGAGSVAAEGNISAVLVIARACSAADRALVRDWAVANAHGKSA